MKIIAVKVFQRKQLKRRNLKKFRLERNRTHDLCDTGAALIFISPSTGPLHEKTDLQG